MKVRAMKLLLTMIWGFSFGSALSENSFAKDKKPNPEELIAAHLKSIGSPELLAGIKTRGISGKSSMEFIQGGVGNLSGQGIVVASGNCLSFILKYGGVDYPGEYLAFNGTDIEVANIKPGQRSPLGDFIYRYNGIMKEGLLGGVWSLGWPLLNTEKKKPSLKYFSAKVDGRELHGIEYNPKGGLNSVKVKLFFDPDTSRHVRTEYMLKVEGEQALQAGQKVNQSVARDGEIGTLTRDAGITDRLTFSYYKLTEKFDDFKEVKLKDSNGNQTGGLILPHNYTLEYSVDGQGSSFLARWIVIADKWMHNGNLDPILFKVH